MNVPIEASDADIAAAVKALRAGELVAFPTETVYGLGADAGTPLRCRVSMRPRVVPPTIR